MLGSLNRYPRAVRIWETVYEDGINRGHSKERASRNAWYAVKKSGYYKRGDEWRIKGVRGMARRKKKRTKSEIKRARMRSLKKARAALRKKRGGAKKKVRSLRKRRKVSKRKISKRKVSKKRSKRRTSKRSKKITVNVYV